MCRSSASDPSCRTLQHAAKPSEPLMRSALLCMITQNCTPQAVGRKLLAKYYCWHLHRTHDSSSVKPSAWLAGTAALCTPRMRAGHAMLALWKPSHPLP
jgi:hypothetical protein